MPGEPGPASASTEVFLAFGRVFSGVLRSGQQVWVLPPSHNPADASGPQPQAATAAGLFLMMGRGLERLQVSCLVWGWIRYVGTCGLPRSRALPVVMQRRTSDGVPPTFMPGPPVQAVPAGNVLAIVGLESTILKSATVSSTPLCRPLAPMLFQSMPIVRVAGAPSACASSCVRPCTNITA